MSVVELKTAIYQAIDGIKDKEQLEQIFSFIASQGRSDELTEEQIKVLEERHARYLNGEEETVTIADVQAHMRNKYGF